MKILGKKVADMFSGEVNTFGGINFFGIPVASETFPRINILWSKSAGSVEAGKIIIYKDTKVVTLPHSIIFYLDLHASGLHPWAKRDVVKIYVPRSGFVASGLAKISARGKNSFVPPFGAVSFALILRILEDNFCKELLPMIADRLLIPHVESYARRKDETEEMPNLHIIRIAMPGAIFAEFSLGAGQTEIFDIFPRRTQEEILEKLRG